MVAAADASPSSARQREPRRRCARLPQDAAQRASLSRHGVATEVRGASRQRDDDVEVGEQDRLVRRHHDGPTVEPGLDGRRQARHGRRVEGGRRLVEQQDGCGAEQGAGECHALALAAAECEPVVTDHGVQARRAGWP